VLRLLVPPQVHLPLEGLVAQLAGEGLVAGVLAGMRYQVGALAEGLAAHLALVRFLTCNKDRIEHMLVELVWLKVQLGQIGTQWVPF